MIRLLLVAALAAIYAIAPASAQVRWTTSGLSSGAAVTFADGNLTVFNSGSSNSTAHIRASDPVDSTVGVYFTVKFTAIPGVRWNAAGIIDATVAIPTVNSNLAPNTWILCDDGQLSINGGSLVASGTGGFVANDIAMFAIKDGKLWVGRNGTWVGNPAAGTGFVASGLPALIYAKATEFTYQGSPGHQTADFGDQAFSYPAPTGFAAYKDAIQAPPSPPVAYANPVPNPWPVLTNIAEYTYRSVGAATKMIPADRYPTLALSPAYRETICTGSMPLNAGDVVDARLTWGDTNDTGQAGEFSGMIMLRKATDTGSESINNAGPAIDPRVMSENTGTNVTLPVHHHPQVWFGRTVVVTAGSYRVCGMHYFSWGDTPQGCSDNNNPATYTPSCALVLHDGDLIATVKRSQ